MENIERKNMKMIHSNYRKLAKFEYQNNKIRSMSPDKTRSYSICYNSPRTILSLNQKRRRETRNGITINSFSNDSREVEYQFRKDNSSDYTDEDQDKNNIDGVLSEHINLILQEVFDSEDKNQEKMNSFRDQINEYIENGNFTPEIIMDYLEKKLRYIMERKKENAIEMYCSKCLIETLQNHKSKVSEKDGNSLLGFWKKYKNEIDKVVDELNRLYSNLVHSAKHLNFIFEMPIRIIETIKNKPKSNISIFIKEKFYEIINQDKIIQTLIHEIKNPQNDYFMNEKGKKIEIDTSKSQGIFGKNTNCSTSIDDKLSEESYEREIKKKKKKKTKKNKETKAETSSLNFKDLNDLVNYINEEEDESKKKSINSKTVQSTNKLTKKNKKRKNKALERNKEYSEEEDRLILEFKNRLENNSKVLKKNQKIKPLFSRRFLDYLGKTLHEL